MHTHIISFAVFETNLVCNDFTLFILIHHIQIQVDPSSKETNPESSKETNPERWFN